jgi:hypothetical protein
MTDLVESLYLLSPARTLRETCHETGRDADGRLCSDCPVADLCAKQARTRRSFLRKR